MTIQEAKHIHDLVAQKSVIQELIEISENYDFELFATFHSQHNSNRQKSITKGYALSEELKKLILKDIYNDLQKVESELQSMEVIQHEHT